MLNPIFYPLEKAAEFLHITQEELIQLAIVGRIRIVIPTTDNLCFWVETVDYQTNKLQQKLKSKEWMEFHWFLRYGINPPEDAYLTVHQTSLKDLLAGYLDQYLIIYLDHHTNGDLNERISVRNPCTGGALLLKEAKLLVLAKDLEQLKHALQQQLAPEQRSLAVDGASTTQVLTDQRNEKLVDPSKNKIDDNKLKSEKQIAAILDAMRLKQFDPMRIPDGAKGALRKICRADYPNLFNTDSSFTTAWKKGVKQNLFRMENHAGFAMRKITKALQSKSRWE